MSEQPKKWKRGDIGPDGRVFWKYDKRRKNGVVWLNQSIYESTYEKKSSNARVYYKKNRERILHTDKLYKEKNCEQVLDKKRRLRLKKTFLKQDGSSYVEWWNSLKRHTKTSKAIYCLIPDPGQTLAELIHELSGYPMEVCEQIANPPAPVEETTQSKKLDNPTPADTLPVGPDLF